MAINYLNNRDLLIEIHNSKLTYCYYLNKPDAYYDAIVRDLTEITPEFIEQTKINKADAMTSAKKKQLKEIKAKPTEIKAVKIDPNGIQVEDLVFRLMTFEHIPIDEIRNAKADANIIKNKNFLMEEGHTQEEIDKFNAALIKAETERFRKTNFKPFKHYRVEQTINVEFNEVLRSHWEDGFDNGQFSLENGYITNKLAMMFMKLVEKFSQKNNWRGYTFIDEMRSQALLQLTQIGLQFDESRSTTPNPFAYYTAAVNNSFKRVWAVEKKSQNIRDELLIMNNKTPSYTRQVEDEAKQRKEMEERMAALKKQREEQAAQQIVVN